MERAIRGTTRECIKHMAATLSGDPAATHKALLLLEVYTARITNTIRKWFSGQSLPRGIDLIRIRILLAELGYRVVELEKYQKSVRQIAELFAVHAVKLEEVRSFIRFSRNSTMNVLVGVQPVGKATEIRLQQLYETCRAHLPQTESVLVKTVDALKQYFLPISEKPDEHDHIISALSSQIRAMLPLVNLVASDGFTAAERERVRELAGNDSVFKLSNQLFALCGERARHAVSSRKGGKK